MSNKENQSELSVEEMEARLRKVFLQFNVITTGRYHERWSAWSHIAMTEDTLLAAGEPTREGAIEAAYSKLQKDDASLSEPQEILGECDYRLEGPHKKTPECKNWKAAPTAAGSEEPKPLKFNLENPGEMIAASGAVKALHDAGYRAAPVASQAPAPKRPDGRHFIRQESFNDACQSYMDYLEGQLADRNGTIRMMKWALEHPDCSPKLNVEANHE